ncbi:MAG TPA: hypothetical protein VNT76_11205, partial [Candidatus Binatus sp.]|nr:hypothetical protein [Candidatus Binatus sp.]
MNFVLGRGLGEVIIHSFIDERIVASHGRLENVPIHRLCLVFVLDRGGEFAQRVGAEKVTVRIDIGRHNFPTFARNRVGIEDCPLRPG